MGTTGAGKSTSISYLTKEAVVVGYGIKSCKFVIGEDTSHQ
jgi:putative protein kinase ArgK-like GTPase of G3E family